MRVLRRVVNTHPFWSTWLSAMNIGSILLIIGVNAFPFATGDDYHEHTLPAIILIGISMVATVVYLRAVFVDYLRLRQARYMVENATYFLSLMAPHKLAFMFYLAGIVRRDDFPHNIDNFENLCHRDQLRICLEYLKYLRYTKGM